MQSLKSKIPLLFIFCCFFLCVVCQGGMFWQHCIIPFLLLLVYCFINIKSIGNLDFFEISILSLIIILQISSLFLSQGDFQIGIYECEKFAMFLCAYLAGKALWQNELAFHKVIMYSCLIVSIIGIISYCGIYINQEYIFSNAELVRLQSFFGYANTTACFLGCGYFAFLNIYLQQPKRLYLPIGACIIFALFLTFSKACIPLFVIISVYFTVKKSDARHVFVYQSVISLICAVTVAICVKYHFYLLAGLISVICVVLCSIIPNKLHGIIYKLFLFCTLLAAVSGILIIILKPECFSTFYLRLEYSADALKLLKDNIFFGIGPGSWRYLQYGVQDSMYNVTHIHNGILQFAVENGLLFALALIILLLKKLFGFFKTSDVPATCMLLLILSHSIFDFDLSFGAMLMLLGFIASKDYPSEITHQSSAVSKIKIFPIALALSVLTASLSYMICEYSFRKNFENAYLEGNKEKAIQCADKLLSICPGDSYLHVSIAALHEQRGSPESTIVEYLEKAHFLSPNDKDIFRNYMKYNVNEINASKLLKKFIDFAPKHEKTYTDAKSLVSDLEERSIIDTSQAEKLISEIDSRRITEGVIDRNNLLADLVAKKNNKK